MGRIVIGIAVSILLLGFGWTWLLGGYSDTTCSLAYPSAPEGSIEHVEAALWPPGGRCVYELPSGEVVTRSGPVPWFEWAFLTVLGALVGALGLLIRKTHSRASTP
jgi:hypothetical protein